jgi:type IV secretory pathway component VirB8
MLGKKRNIGYGWSFVFCFLLGPLIGLIIILCSKKKDVYFVDVQTNDDLAAIKKEDQL